MLGEKLVEEMGKITGYRVRPSDGMCPKVEVSFQAAGSSSGLTPLIWARINLFLGLMGY
jgi:hypothetical protein